jgi:protein-S-isoprenylcysteine O-methyltransferase Ste14
MPPAALVTLAACWGLILVAWVAGALYGLFRARPERSRRRSGAATIIGTVAVCAMLAVLLRRYTSGLTVAAPWARGLGLAILILSTAFALWARVTLGTMWSVAPRVKGDRRLRTHGPYAVTRHPIYSGLLGMLLGTTLLAGVGELIALVPVGLIFFEVKIRQEERLLLATFPEEYPEYRRVVPQLIPGLHTLRLRRRPRGAAPSATESKATDPVRRTEMDAKK